MSRHRDVAKTGWGPALTASRVTLGLLFTGHGARKLAPVMGGTGLKGATEQMEALGLKPPRANALLAAATQLAGGVLLSAGLLTPIGAAAIAANMIVVMRTSCAGRGPWGVNGGWEYPLVLSLAALTIAEQGPGPLSLDRLLGTERSGPAVAALTLAAAGGASGSVLGAAKRAATP